MGMTVSVAITLEPGSMVINEELVLVAVLLVTAETGFDDDTFPLLFDFEAMFNSS